MSYMVRGNAKMIEELFLSIDDSLFFVNRNCDVFCFVQGQAGIMDIVPIFGIFFAAIYGFRRLIVALLSIEAMSIAFFISS